MKVNDSPNRHTNNSKILAIHNILWSHYKARIFTGLSSELSKVHIDFHVIQLALSEQSRISLKPDLELHKYPHTVLFSEKTIEEIGSWEKIIKLLKAVSKHKPHLVYLNGYYDIAYWFVFIYCKIFRIRIILDFESNEISRPRIWWKEKLKRLILKHSDGLVCLGKKAMEYALKLGVHKNQILTTKNVGVDNDTLLHIYNQQLQYAEVRKRQLNLPKYNFLYAGRFVKRKNLERLIIAFSRAKSRVKHGSDWGLILSGDGDQKEVLSKLAADLANNSITFMDPCEWYEVPIRYTLADVAVLPSTFEPFGFLTNEAMVYSMPVLVSERCGGAADLVIDDCNGYQFNPFDEEDLENKLVRLMKEPDRFSEFGNNGKLLIDQWRPDVIVEELINSFYKVLTK